MDENQFQIKEEKPDDGDINSEGNLVTQHLDIKEELIEEVVEKIPNIKNENFVDIIDIKNEKNGDHSDQIFSSEEIDPLLNIYDSNTIDEKAFKCETCMTFFATRKELNLHYATFLGNCCKEKSSAVYEERKMFECQYLGCESRFTSYENLRNHMKFSKNHIDIGHEKDTPEHQCTYCEFKSDSKTKLTIHIRANHEEIRFVCALCDKTFKRKDYLKAHIACGHEEKSQYNCSLCSYKCEQKSRMDRHVEEVHEKKNRLKCELCTKTFSASACMTAHVAAVHEKVKPEHQCQYCDFKSDSDISK